MIIKNNSTTLLITISILLILPFVQKQWFNLYLFNISDISFYSILYYLSGIICPFLVCLNSLNNYTYYKFNNNKICSKKLIRGKALLFLVTINLMLLSYLIIDYVYINFDFIINLFFDGIKFQQPDIFQLSFLMLLFAIFLIFKKSRLLFKKLILVNFSLISFYIWYLQLKDINLGDKLHIYRYSGFHELNLINVFILLTIEVTYLIWSFLSYKTNLSDWMVNAPLKEDMIPIFNIFIFYFFIIIYYSILN